VGNTDPMGLDYLEDKPWGKYNLTYYTPEGAFGIDGNSFIVGPVEYVKGTKMVRIRKDITLVQNRF
jgi:hypothetical protein